MPHNVMFVWPPEHDSSAPTAAEVCTKLINIARESMDKQPRKLALPVPATNSLRDIAGTLLMTFRILDDEYFESKLREKVHFNFTRYATHHQAGKAHGYFESPMQQFGQHALDFRRVPLAPAVGRPEDIPGMVDLPQPQGLGIYVPTTQEPGPSQQVAGPSGQDQAASNAEASIAEAIVQKDGNEVGSQASVRPPNIPKGQYESASLTILELGPKNDFRCTAEADEIWFSLPYVPAAYDRFCADMNRGHTAYTETLPLRVQMRRYTAILIHECIHAYFALHTCNCSLPQCRPARSHGSQLGKTGHGALFIDALRILGATLVLRQHWEPEMGEHIGTPGYQLNEIWQYLINPLVDLESECIASNWVPDATQLERWGLDLKTVERYLRGDKSVCVVM